MKWVTADLIGSQVFLEVVDAYPMIRPRGFAWIAFADYRQEEPPVLKPVERADLTLYQLTKERRWCCVGRFRF